MKKIIFILAAAFALASCEKVDLCYLTHPHGQPVNVVIHWDEPPVYTPTAGMRTNLLALGPHANYGITDLDYWGGQLNLPLNTVYMPYCYDYFGSANILFRNEDSAGSIEAYSTALVRATYTKSFPTENTISEPGYLYMDKIESFSVLPSDEPLEMHFYPEDVVKVYTFEVRDVRGATYITDTRGAMSGVSGSYFMLNGGLAATSSTMLFSAVKDAATNRITGSFRTFGRLNETNIFTIEILYPSATNGLVQLSWDVTNQIDTGGTHIVISADIDIIPDSNGGGSGFDAIVDEWDDVQVPIPL